MLTPDQVEWLRCNWFRLLDTFRVDASAAEPVLNSLIAAYSTPDRFYHNLEHIHEMFDMVQRLAWNIPLQPEVNLAIWFHDAVYDTRSKDSEERSAALAAASLRPLGLPPGLIDRVARLIRATAHLAAPTPPPDADTALLLDADLAVLGSPEDRYRRYAADVRREYAWVPDEDYRNGRARVLQSFLARPRIYWGGFLYEERDAKARLNMTDELASLDRAGG